VNLLQNSCTQKSPMHFLFEKKKKLKLRQNKRKKKSVKLAKNIIEINKKNKINNAIKIIYCAI
jgi:hypothetical protein